MFAVWLVVVWTLVFGLWSAVVVVCCWMSCVRCSLCVGCCEWLVCRCSLFAVCCLQSVVPWLLRVVVHVLLGACCLVIIGRCLSFVGLSFSGVVALVLRVALCAFFRLSS